MPSEPDKDDENLYKAPEQPEQSRFPRWMLIVVLVAAALIAAMVAIPVLIILAIDLQRIFLN